MKKVLAVFTIGLLAITSSGCIALLAGAAAGGGTAVWLSGKLRQEVSVSRDRAAQATTSALESLKMKVDKMTKAEEVTQIRSTYTDGREVWIDIRPITTTSSAIEVRVGAVGDKEAADTILKRITRYL